MNLLEVMKNRRSIRTYSQEPIPDEYIDQIIESALSSPSSKARRPWELIVVKDIDKVHKLSGSRDHFAEMLKQASCAIVVIADPNKSDMWIEDCSIVMTNMHLMADYLGIGSCWVQARSRFTSDGKTSEDYIKELLGIPDNYKLLATLSLGMPKKEKTHREIDKKLWDKIHYDKF